MPSPTTPIARSKTAALSRILNSVPHGYDRYTCGVIAPEKIPALVKKLHRLHAIAATPAQRIRRKKLGQANALLVLYCPDRSHAGNGMDAEAGAYGGDSPGAHTSTFQVREKAQWLMLFTAGDLGAHEELRSVLDKPRLGWLGYELTRYAHNGRTRWTWKRPDEAMREIYGQLEDRLKRRRWGDIQVLLQNAARQPGFHGVRGQSWRLGEFARRSGYRGELPVLYYIRKVEQGERILCG